MSGVGSEGNSRDLGNRRRGFGDTSDGETWTIQLSGELPTRASTILGQGGTKFKEMLTQGHTHVELVPMGEWLLTFCALGGSLAFLFLILILIHPYTNSLLTLIMS